MNHLDQGLRCQDIHTGLSAVDPNSAPLAQLVDTRLVGMAASLASSIRGQNIVRDAQTLKMVAAEQLDVDSLAFEQVVGILYEAGYVTDVQKKAGKIASFTESIPFHQDLYSTLGEIWGDRAPTETEQQLLVVVNQLAKGPIPQEELIDRLNIERESRDVLLNVAKRADLVKSVNTVNGDILYSPFLGFENPDTIDEIFRAHGSDQLQEEFASLHEYQGLPIDDTRFPALSDAVARGLILAPTVERPDGFHQAFATLPYSINRELFSVRKSVLDKALAVLACIRCGEHFGGVSNITRPLSILNALLDPDRNHQLRPHGSTRRQYQPLFRMQVMDFTPSGSWAVPKLIPTEDNLEAVRLARDLLVFGEPLEDRVGDEREARALLNIEGRYRTPMQTLHDRRERIRMSDKNFEKAMDALMGRTAL